MPSVMHSTSIQQIDLIRIGVALICQEWQGWRSWAVHQMVRSKRLDHMAEVLLALLSDEKVTMCFSSSFDATIKTGVSVETNDAQ